MNVELNKEFGYEQARDNGVDMLYKTLTRSAVSELSGCIANDLTTMLNQAVKAVTNPEQKVIAIAIHMGKLIGYLEELARVTGALAEGWEFELTERPGSIYPELTIRPRKA